MYRSMRIRTAAVTFVMVATLALAMPTRDAVAQKYGGTATVAMGDWGVNVDPHAAGVSRERSVHIYESLMSRNGANEPVTDLAESYEISDDLKTFTFRLRAGIKFHDGSALDSSDIKATFERIGRIGLDKKIMDNVESIGTPDDLTVVFNLKEPGPIFLRQVSSPRSILAVIPSEDGDKDVGKLSWIGTGPYKVVSREDDVEVFERYDDYQLNETYEGTEGLAGKKVPYLDRIIFRSVPEVSARVAGLETGEYTVVDDVTSRSAIRFESNPDIDVQKLMPWQILAVHVNFVQPPTDNLKFRRAIQIGLNMDELMLLATDDNYRLSHGYQYPDQGFYAETGKDLYDLRDVEGAKKLLEESGYDGEELVLITRYTSLNALNGGVALSQQLKKLGINMRMEVYDNATWTAKRKTKDAWNIAFNTMGTATWVGPWFVMQRWSGPTPIQHMADPVMQKLIVDLQTKPTLEGQKAAFAGLQERVVNEAISIKFGDAGRLTATRSNLRGYKPFRVFRLWNVWLDQ